MHKTYRVNATHVETIVPAHDGSDVILLDIDEIWASQFAYWDTLVDSDTAARLATSITDTLKQIDINEPYWQETSC